ncbi:MAG: VWA domain-containing protein, partial [Myxococcota bacterium]
MSWQLDIAGLHLAHPEWLLLVVPLALLWALALWPDRKNRWARGALMLLFILVLADPGCLTHTGASQTILLLDRSLSVEGKALERGKAIAEQIDERGRAIGHGTTVIAFGRGATVIARGGESMDAIASLDQHDESDLAAGLRLAAALSPIGGAGDILLISDGRHTGSDPLAEVPGLRERGLRIHTLTIESQQGGDVAITRLLGPNRSALGQPFTIGAEIHAPSDQTARLRLLDATGHEILRRTVQLEAGTSRYAFSLLPGSAGLHLYTVALDVKDDPLPQNNRARAAISIESAPRVLVINPKGQPTAVTRALSQSGLTVELRNSGQRVTSAGLHGVSAVVLENLPLSQLNDGADSALAHYVVHMGGGLVLTGGRQSFATGGYFRSDLEPLLPVVMDRQEELRRPKLALGIVMDRSGSMSVSVAGGGSKMDLANRSAVEAIELLAPEDEIVVLAVDSASHIVVDREVVGFGDNRRDITRRVLAIESMGGGIYVYNGLATAVQLLLDSNAPTRHILLLADAADAEQPGEYRTLIKKWRRAGGSISTVGLGSTTDPDADLLRDIAKRGKGRIYFTANAERLPRIFVEDVMHVARETFVEHRTPVLPARGLTALEFVAATIPNVGGYNLTFLAPDADLMLMTGDDNAAPLIAGWQRRSGKVLAITFEADGRFTGALGKWKRYKALLRHAIEWVKSGESVGELSADIRISG